MRVRNLDAYTKVASAPQSLTVKVVDGSSTPEGRDFVTFAFEALATHPSVSKAALAPDLPPGFEPDVTITMNPEASYEGSWVNYPITFPGFLVFAHAWNGFEYEANLDTVVSLSGPAIAGEVKEVIATNYDLRYCDTDRGIATSSGWYTPGWGGLNLLIGFYNVSYDDDGSSAFRDRVRSSYGRYVANSAIELINAHRKDHANVPGTAALPTGLLVGGPRG